MTRRSASAYLQAEDAPRSLEARRGSPKGFPAVASRGDPSQPPPDAPRDANLLTFWLAIACGLSVRMRLAVGLALSARVRRVPAGAVVSRRGFRCFLPVVVTTIAPPVPRAPGRVRMAASSPRRPDGRLRPQLPGGRAGRPRFARPSGGSDAYTRSPGPRDTPRARRVLKRQVHAWARYAKGPAAWDASSVPAHAERGTEARRTKGQAKTRTTTRTARSATGRQGATPNDGENNEAS